MTGVRGRSPTSAAGFRRPRIATVRTHLPRFSAVLVALLPATALAHTLRGLLFTVAVIPTFIVSSLIALVVAYRMCKADKRWRVLPWVVCALLLFGVLHFQLSVHLLETGALQPVLAPLGVNDELICASLVPLSLPALTWLAFRLARRSGWSSVADR